MPPKKTVSFDEGEDEMLSHDLSGEYEGAQWIGGEFFFTKQKKQRRAQSKDEAIYGYDSEEEEREKRQQSSDRRRQDLQKPMNFVARGAMKLGDGDHDDEEEEEEEDGNDGGNDDDEEHGNKAADVSGGAGEDSEDESGASGDSEDEDRFSRRQQRQQKQQQQQQQAKNETHEVEPEDQNAEQVLPSDRKRKKTEELDEDDIDGSARVGLGFSSTSKATGTAPAFAPAFTPANTLATVSSSKPAPSFTAASVGVRTGARTAATPTQPQAPTLPTSFGKQNSSSTTTTTNISTDRKRSHDRDSTRSRKAAVPIPGLSELEMKKYGKGYELMKKMGGWRVGEGIGKKGQGRAAPVLAKLRPTAMGLGFNNFRENENVATAPATGDTEADAQGDQRPSYATPAAPRPANWKRGQEKKKRVYMTAEELAGKQVSTQAAPVAGLAAVKPVQSEVVVDMRGPSVKVVNMDQLTSLQQEQWTPTASGRSAFLPELQHNLRLLVDLMEGDIHRISRERQHCNDSIVALSRERSQMEAAVLQEKEMVEHTEAVLEAIDECNKKVSHAHLADPAELQKHLDIVVDVFNNLQHKYLQVYRRNKLAALALAMATPLLKAFLTTWNPLGNIAPQTQRRRTEDVLPILTQWQLLLSGEMMADSTMEDQEKKMAKPRNRGQDVYRTLLDQMVLPILHRSITSQWNARDSGPLQQLLHTLKPLLPQDTYADILSQLVVARLKVEVAAWNPRKDTTPIHTWLHPWLAILPDDEMQPIYQDIRYKLSIALQEWRFSDVSAYVLISPWHKVFREGDFAALLARSIAPKLVVGLNNEFVVNPKQQVLDPFNWVMKWQPLMPPRLIVRILYSAFFPKWFEALYKWLKSSDVDFSEVSRWYTGWKQMFPAALRDHLDIKSVFAKALDLLNAAVDDKPLEPLYTAIKNFLLPQTAKLAPGISAALRSTSLAQSVPQPVANQQLSLEDDDTSFKDNIEQFAASKNIVFRPNDRRGKYDGKQIFLFGPVNVYLENRCIYAYEHTDDGGESWKPIALDELLARAQS